MSRISDAMRKILPEQLIFVCCVAEHGGPCSVLGNAQQAESTRLLRTCLEAINLPEAAEAFEQSMFAPVALPRKLDS